jgi:hypothetical protein
LFVASGTGGYRSNNIQKEKMDVGSPLSFGHLLLESNKSGDK